MKVEITKEDDLKKKSSVWLSLAFAVIAAVGDQLVIAWGLLPDDMKALLPEGPAKWAVSIAFLMVFLGRVTHIKLKE